MSRKLRLILAHLFSTAVLTWHVYNQYFTVDRDAMYKALQTWGYHPIHTQSCGPIALSKAFKDLGIEVYAGDISNEMLSKPSLENTLRSAMGYLYKPLEGVTFPSEIERVCKNHGLSLEFSTPESTKRALELMWQRGNICVIRLYKSTFEQHWEYLDLSPPKDTVYTLPDCYRYLDEGYTIDEVLHLENNLVKLAQKK